MGTTLLKVAGLVVTVACWLWARNAQPSQASSLLLILGVPLLQYPITLLGRRFLNVPSATQTSERVTMVVHYAMMIVLGTAIFPAIRWLQQPALAPWLPSGMFPVPPRLGRALVWLTGIATGLTVVNLAIRGLGAPFAAKLSSRLATDWMYAWTRNPMLLCTLAFLVAVGFRYQSLWFVIWILLIISPGWIYFVKKYEERELEIRFGASYRAYRQQTPFLWPRRPRRQNRSETREQSADLTRV